MTDQHLSIYLTIELTSSYSPETLSTMKEPEVKLWLCPMTNLPVFSNANYGGPTAIVSGLPTIGHPTIHIRVPNVTVEKSENDDAMKDMLFTIYKQICQQIHLLDIQHRQSANLQRAVIAKQRMIDILTMVFKQKENEYATEIVH